MNGLDSAADMRRAVVERPRPRVLDGITVKVSVGMGNDERPVGNLYVQVNVDDNLMPFEVFLRLGHTDPGEQAHFDALAKAFSYALRIGGDIAELASDLIGVSAYPVPIEGGFIRSAEDGIGKVFRDVANGRYNAMFERGRALRSIAEHRFQERLPIDAPIEGDEQPAVESIGLASSGGLGWQECPECSGRLAAIEGCLTCFECGWSKC